MGENKWLTIPETALKCGCSENSIRNYIRQGDLPAYKVGGKYLIDEEEYREWIQGKRVQPAPAKFNG